MRSGLSQNVHLYVNFKQNPFEPRVIRKIHFDLIVLIEIEAFLVARWLIEINFTNTL